MQEVIVVKFTLKAFKKKKHLSNTDVQFDIQFQNSKIIVNANHRNKTKLATMYKINRQAW